MTKLGRLLWVLVIAELAVLAALANATFVTVTYWFDSAERQRSFTLFEAVPSLGAILLASSLLASLALFANRYLKVFLGTACLLLTLPMFASLSDDQLSAQVSSVVARASGVADGSAISAYSFANQSTACALVVLVAITTLLAAIFGSKSPKKSNGKSRFTRPSANLVVGAEQSRPAGNIELWDGQSNRD